MDSLKISYLLVTAAKNEEDNLPLLVQQITGQLIRPVVWFIVDDCSDDKTSQILEKAVLEYPWIHVIRLGIKHHYDLGKHYSSVCINGFDRAIDYCNHNGIKINYIALSDADMIYPYNYFLECIRFLEDNPLFGIVSGRLKIKNKNGDIHEEDNTHLWGGEPYGTGRIWRMAAFLDSGGYSVVRSPDLVSNIMALEKGWKIKRLDNIVFYQTRDTSGKKGFWRGYFERGERSYYLCSNPLNTLNWFISLSLIPPSRQGIIKGFAFVCGYYKSFIKKDERIENNTVKKYVGSYKRIFINYSLFIKGLVKKSNNSK